MRKLLGLVVILVVIFYSMKIFLLVVLFCGGDDHSIENCSLFYLLKKRLQLGYLRILKRNGWQNSLKML